MLMHLFGFERNDKLEIGPLYKGQGKQAQNSYVEGIADVLAHCKQFLLKNADIFLVANDKYNLYPKNCISCRYENYQPIQKTCIKSGRKR